MMRKNGFTLAEVLITLAIIGVVATMTLPALMSNTGEQQYKTGLKKGINTLTEAAQTNLALEGWDYSLINNTEHATIQDGLDGLSADEYSLLGLLGSRLTVDTTKDNGTDHGTQFSNGVSYTNSVVFLKDGSSILFVPADTTEGTDLVDGLPEGFTVIYDTNGPKAPNIISNCEATVAGVESPDGDNAAEGEDITEACKDRDNRVIRDQFLIQLRGNIAEPRGQAATWAFSN